ncbi:MAG: class I SAM-dependent methyltransferase [Desulfobacteraceae bacterium]|nr:class I SAM-dependent methyltransferase [Desulfobacteraceae bacterium]
MNIKELLAHPLTRGLNIDEPHCTDIRRSVIREKSFLCQIYEEWYESVTELLLPGEKPVLELGSGGGFLNDYIPELITSDIFLCRNASIVLDGISLPFSDESLRGIVMINVLHHLNRPRQFFSEACRCVCSSGFVIMIEPWVTRWSRFIYSKMHHEPFRPDDAEWSFSEKGPLSGANGALPWIIFKRDRNQFEKEYPGWQIHTIKPVMPFRYLLSGGVSLRSIMPGQTFSIWRNIEKVLQPWMNSLAMFALISLTRTDSYQNNL